MKETYEGAKLYFEVTFPSTVAVVDLKLGSLRNEDDDGYEDFI